jgi:hypothetical protein
VGQHPPCTSRRKLTAIWAMTDIQNLSKLLLETVMKLFDLKIVPILTYGLAMIWEHLRENSLKMSESVKVTNIKKALRVSRFTPS